MDQIVCFFIDFKMLQFSCLYLWNNCYPTYVYAIDIADWQDSVFLEGLFKLTLFVVLSGIQFHFFPAKFGNIQLVFFRACERERERVLSALFLARTSKLVDKEMTLYKYT